MQTHLQATLHRKPAGTDAAFDRDHAARFAGAPARRRPSVASAGAGAAALLAIGLLFRWFTQSLDDPILAIAATLLVVVMAAPILFHRPAGRRPR